MRIRAVERRFQPLAQAGQRGAQVVGDIVGDLAMALHQDTDTVQHPVEGRRQPGQFIGGALHRHPARQVPIDDGLGHAGDGGEAPPRVPAKRIAARGAQDHDADQGYREPSEHEPVQGLDPVQVVPHHEVEPVRQQFGVEADGFIPPAAARGLGDRPAWPGMGEPQPAGERAALAI